MAVGSLGPGNGPTVPHGFRVGGNSDPPPTPEERAKQEAFSKAWDQEYNRKQEERYQRGLDPSRRAMIEREWKEVDKHLKKKDRKGLRKLLP